MKEYPSTSKQFKVNDKVFDMKKLTLGMQARIEDENIDVTYVDVVKACTTMTDADIDDLEVDQFQALYEDINTFSYDSESTGEGEPKKQ